ncbi:anhydro-N-acetylmuramic acid kinase [Pseudohongiella spirulinae]|uniref:Anhydro-N-acetylmuramic acid kinase n=1 Tax=Pseudohongiella spirulinae TaxID=1249552 RepID=A0A0S2KFL1_9GAMM|nr:anhydro-N-acetylmuramic acid kinase [Pseudohongiella spirulinae]ALO47120.1 Anhydro-N-acetylmuramic acid kinase [Pseudohongiella spirulinae]
MNHPASAYYIGLISGTSVDSIDCALIETSGRETRLLATQSGKISDSLRSRILTLCSGEPVPLSLLGETDIDVARQFAATALELLNAQQLRPEQISAIGSHGQTVYHHPESASPFSMQIGDPSTIAEITGITTIADFRQRDMAAGGQGAPLAPLFHQHFFYQPDEPAMVLNIGGIANLTMLARDIDETPSGFDTGPGNVLMDSWINAQTGAAFDNGGQWAEGGQVDESLLAQMLDDAYFKRPPPKSTGREYFNGTWLARQIQTAQARTGEANSSPRDIQRTLLELTAVTVARAVERHGKGYTRLAVCGGGAHNRALISRLQQLLVDRHVCSSEALGMAPDWVEAATFAWLAANTLAQKAIDSGSLTGARHPVILGGIYPGRSDRK